MMPILRFARRQPIQILVGLLLVSWPGLLMAQVPGREVITPRPEYRGQVASAPIPPEYHVRNEGGSDGAGLCVISSILANGMYQGVPGLDRPGYDEWTGTDKPGKGSALWLAAKRAPGGYSPDKLQRLVDRVMPGEKYASHIGTDPTVLDRLSREGYPLAVTMNTGERYQGKPIHHYVSVPHYRTGGAACFMDNNDKPGIYRWLPARDFARRMFDGGVIWVWFWTRLPTAARSAFVPLFLLVAALVVWGRSQRAFPDLDGENHEPTLPPGRPALWPGLTRSVALTPTSSVPGSA